MSSGEIIFYMKGADTVMSSIVQYNDWLEEEVIVKNGFKVANRLIVSEVIFYDEVSPLLLGIGRG